MTKTEIKALVREIEVQAVQIFDMDYLNVNKVLFTKRGTTAGTCTYNQSYNFNMHIAENNDGFEQTVYHEVAHQIAYQKYGRAGAGHGKAWKFVMHKLGRTSNRCHSYSDIKLARVTKQYTYKCPRCGDVMTISSVRYNKQMRGKASYRHRCGETLDMTKAVRTR